MISEVSQLGLSPRRSTVQIRPRKTFPSHRCKLLIKMTLLNFSNKRPSKRDHTPKEKVYKEPTEKWLTIKKRVKRELITELSRLTIDCPAALDLNAMSIYTLYSLRETVRYQITGNNTYTTPYDYDKIQNDFNSGK